MSTSNIRSSLYQCLENKLGSGQYFRLFSAGQDSAPYSITVYVSFGNNSFFEANVTVPSDGDDANIHIINASLNENDEVTLTYDKSASNQTLYMTLKNASESTIRKEIKFGTFANLLSSKVDESAIAGDNATQITLTQYTSSQTDTVWEVTSDKNSIQSKQDVETNGEVGYFSFKDKNANAVNYKKDLVNDDGKVQYGAIGAYSTSFGGKSSAQGKRSFACGTTTISTGDYSFAGGNSSVALGGNSFAVGLQTTAVGNNSFSAGNNTVAEGENAIALGWESKAIGVASTTMGRYGESNGQASLTEGVSTKTLNEIPSSDRPGSGTSGSGGGGASFDLDANLGMAAHAEGDSGWAVGYGSHVEGYAGTAIGHYSHVEGVRCKVDKTTSLASHAGGYNTVVTGTASQAHGSDNSVTGDNSTVFGVSNTATGDSLFVTGSNNVVKGTASASFGSLNKITAGTTNFVLGTDLESGYDAQTIVGKHNSNKSYTLFEVGNGSSSSDRRNAFEVLSDGRAKVQTAPTESTDVVRKKELDDETKRATDAEFTLSSSLSEANTKISTLQGYFTDGKANNALKADSATTATNLAEAPSLAASSNAITVTVGGQTSAPFDVPYAKKAGKVSIDNISSANIYLAGYITTSTDHLYSNADSTTTPYYTSAGQLNAVSFNATSDRRLKENIADYHCEKSILDLPVKRYDFTSGLKNQIGCIAQDLREICPEIVSEGDNGYLSIQESKIVYLLLQEVREQRDTINRLEARIDELSKKIS